MAVTLRQLLGEATPPLAEIQAALLEAFAQRFGIEWQAEALTPAEETLALARLREEIGTEEFVAEIDDPAADADFLVGTHTCAGGTISAFLRLEGPARDRIGQLLITGDFFVAPPRIVLDLEAALRRVRLDDVGAAIERFFAERPVSAITVSPQDFRSAVELAARYARREQGA
jgi:lipoate-protein ligase A